MSTAPTATDSVHARVGSVLHNKWVLGPVIGSGGTAAVYEGTHRSNGRRVAVKIMHAHLASSSDVVARFQREGYIANKVGHPGAVAILDDDKTEDGAPFLVMDRLDGAPLTKLLDRKKSGLEIGPTLRIAHEILDILAAAHAQGITHRDIKPDNVFLTVSGRVMILDFGIARLREQLYAGVAPGGADLTVRMQAQTQEGLTLGTPLYMSPEQARGRWAEVDARSDLWSVGAIMFRLLTGKPVRSATNPADMLLQAMTQRTPRVVDVAPEISAEVAGIVDRALEMDKADRWPDAASMQKAVRDAASRASATRAPLPSVGPDEIPVPPMPPLRSLAPPPHAPFAKVSQRKLLVVGGVVLAGLVALAYTPRAAHGPAHDTSTNATATAIPSQVEVPAPTSTAAPTETPAQAQAPAVTTVNVDDLPSAPLVEPPQPTRHTHRHPPAATPPTEPAPSVLDRRH